MGMVEISGRSEAEKRLGLSSGHISTEGEVIWSEKGGYIRLRAHTGAAGDKRPRVKRGLVRGFSHGSRSRLMQEFAAMDLDNLPKPLFITLTYPTIWDTDWHVWKDNLDKFYFYLRKRLGDCPCVWKLELQQRGAPHFHIMAFTEKWLSMGDLMFAWWEIVGSKQVEHLLAGTQVKRVRSKRGVMFYASKYLSKVTDESDTPQEMGRCWGIWHRAGLGMAYKSMVVTLGEFQSIKRILRRLRFGCKKPQEKGSYWQGMWTFLGHELCERLIALMTGGGEPGGVLS